MLHCVIRTESDRPQCEGLRYSVEEFCILDVCSHSRDQTPQGPPAPHLSCPLDCRVLQALLFRQSLSPGVFQLGPTRRSPAGVEVGVACPISVQLQVLMEPASWGRGFNGCFSKAAAFCPPAPSASLAAVFPACSLDSLTTLTVFKTHTCSPLGETGSLGGSGRGYKADTLLPVE